MEDFPRFAMFAIFVLLNLRHFYLSLHGFIIVKKLIFHYNNYSFAALRNGRPSKSLPGSLHV